MNAEKRLKKIPVVLEGAKQSNHLHLQRRVFQLGMVLLAVLIPLTGLFRIDPIVGAFVVLDHQIWWSDFFIVFGFWVAVAASLVLAYSIVGTAFCGWVCPQNLLAEWANHITQKFLGKRAFVELDGRQMQLAKKKNSYLNWLILGMLILSVSMFFALIPLLYFYPPDVIWSFVSMQYDSRLAPSLHYIYIIFVILLFVDIGFIRHFMCKFMCIYKVWQHGFKTKQTLHIEYDASRAEQCDKCNYCVTACFIDIDPKSTDVYDTCINCGECITACNNLQAKKGNQGLLSFVIGERGSDKQNKFKNNVGSLFSRSSWSLGIVSIGLLMFVWGLFSYEPHRISVYRADTLQGAQISDYRVAIFNKLYRPAELKITLEGMSHEQYSLQSDKALFETAGKININLHVKPGLKKGLHSFIVHIESDNGWKDSYPFRHFQG